MVLTSFNYEDFLNPIRMQDKNRMTELFDKKEFSPEGHEEFLKNKLGTIEIFMI